jgi:3-oxoacyl-[acyl-carrier-protein] synthase II
MPTIDRERFGVGIASLSASLNAATVQFPTNNASSAALCTERVYYLPCSVAFNHKLHGQTFTILNACAAGTIAIGDAYRLVRSGAMDLMVAGAVDFNVHPYAYRFMEKLGALRTDCNDNPEDILCPFDAKRDGTSLADGGAIMIIETLESA